MELKDKLKELRREKHLTQESLAREIHVSRSAIAKWEAGLGIPSEDSIEALCKFFNIERGHLISDIGVETIFVEKNLKIRKGQRFIFVLGAILLTLSVFFSSLAVYKGVEVAKHREEVALMKTLVPTVQKVYFENPTMMNIEDEVPMLDGKYVLEEKKWTKVYFEVDVDERIAKSWYAFTPIFEDFDAIALQEISSRDMATSSIRRFRCSIYVRPLRKEVSQLKISEFTYFHVIDGEGWNVECEIESKGLPIMVKVEE